MSLPRVQFWIALVVAALSAPAWAHLEETVSRPVGLYVFNPSTEKTEYLLVNLFTSDLTSFHMEDASRKTVCNGQLQTRGRDWIFRNVNCFQGALLVSEVVLAERFKFGVLRHGLASTQLPDGRQVGFFLHLGSESTAISEAQVSAEKIKDLYGDFPNWKIPK